MSVHSAELAYKDGPILWVTLSRPEKANALDSHTVTQLLKILDDAEADPAIRVMIFTGAGRNFCAGADLEELISGDASGIRVFMERLRSLLDRLERTHLITIAAVHGGARAGGLELSLACDVILAARSCTFGDAHLANGLLPAGGSTARLPRAVGWQRAKWLILSAEAIDAYTARDWGLVLDVIDDSDLKDAARRIGESMLKADPQTIKRAKRLLTMVSEQPLSVSLEAEIATLERHFYSDDFQNGVRRFLDRKAKRASG